MHKVSVIKDKSGVLLTETDEIQKRWTDYDRDLYNYDIKTDTSILNEVQESISHDSVETEPGITIHEVEDAIRTMKVGKAAGVDNIHAELLKTGDEVVDILHRICN